MMAATTGDADWEKRYRVAEAKLDQTLKELTRLDSLDFIVELLKTTDDANIRLIAMENRAFELVRLGQRPEAFEILSGDEYNSLKKIYAEGFLKLVELYHQKSTLEQARLKSETTRSKWFFGLAIIFLTIIWMPLEGFFRRSSKQVLQKNQELSLLLENAPAMTYSCLAYGNFDATYISANIQKKLGYTTEEFLKIPGFWATNIHPDDKERVFAEISNLFEKGEYQHEYRFMHKNGEWRWMSDALKLTTDSKGAPKEIIGYWLDITEKKMFENEITVLNERFQLIAKATNDTIYDWDLLSNTAWWGNGITKMFGYGAEEIENTLEWFMDRVHPNDHDIVGGSLDHAIGEGLKNWTSEYKFRHRNGNYIDVFDRAFLLFNADGNPVRFVGSMLDITERRQAEEKIIKAQEQLQESIKASGVGFFDLDLQTNKGIASTEWKKQIGYEDDELQLTFELFVSLLHPDDARYVVESMKEFMEGKRDFFEAEYRVRHKDGSYHWILARASIKRDENGKPIQLFGSHLDITERKQAEEKISMLSQAVKSTGDCIAITDKDYQIVFVNESFAKTYYYAIEEIVGQPISAIISTNNLPEVVNNLYPAMARNENWIGEVINKRKDGIDFPVFLSVSPLLNEKRELIGIVGITRDITEQKQHEQALLEAKNQAQTANLAKSEFLANMSHELRTPLNGIIGMAELTTHTALTPKQLHFVQNIKKSGESLLAIINDLLDFSKIEAGKMILQEDEFIIRDELASVLKPLGTSASEKNIELLYAVESTIPTTLITDSLRLLQIIINLIGNAIKFTKQGSVLLKVKEESRNAETINLHFIISDTGIGIAHEKQELIFKAFEQADSSVVREFGGTGLGLSVSSALVKLFGGHIRVESHLDQGTDFHFSIPMKISTKPEKMKYNGEYMDGLRVLIVEDSKTAAELLKQIFTAWRMKPTIESSGESALLELRKALLENKPYQLLSLDIDLPGMNGFGVLETIRKDENFKNFPVIIITKSHKNSDYDKAKKLGVDAFFTKPFSHSELLEAIHELLLRHHTPDDKIINVGEEIREHPTKSEYQLPPLHILVAEDNIINQEIVYELLIEKSHSITLAINGQEALDLSMNNNFDLILMDIQMPVMDGITATQQIRLFENGKGKHVPIIALTARAMKEDKEKCLASGMDAWVSKPLRPKELFKAMYKLLSGKAVASEPLFQNEDVDIDLTAALEIFGGNKKLLKRIIEIYIDQSPEILAELEQAFESNDKDLIYNALHKFKGGFPAFIPQKVLDFFVNLEQSVEAGKLSGLDQKTQQISKFHSLIVGKFNLLLENLRDEENNVKTDEKES